MKSDLLPAVLFCLNLLAPEAQAQVQLGLSADASLSGKYVWRGLVITDGAVFQPGLTAGFRGFSLNFWSNLDFNESDSRNSRFTETDYTLDYTYSLAPCNFSLGSIVYDFPNTNYRATTELYCGLSADLALKPALKVFSDLDETGGTYVNLSLGKSFQTGWAESSLNLKAALGFGSTSHNRFYYNCSKATFTDCLLGLSINFSLADNITLTPGLYGSFMLDRSIRQAIPAKADNLFFGLTLASSL